MTGNPYAISNGRPRIGLIAGWGEYPVIVADRLRDQGFDVCCIGIEGHADRALEDRCFQFQSAGLCRMSTHIRFFRRHGAHRVTMAGKIHKVLLFRRDFFLKNLPDLRCVRSYFPHFVTGSQSRADDSLLNAAVNGYARGGIDIIPATDLLPELLIKMGFLSRDGLNNKTKDIEFGWEIAKSMGRMDIGQTVVVKGQAVLAVEAVEGTDECIRRAGTLCPQGGFTVVKVAKPQQDMRFDVPTIGIGTLQTLVQAGGKVLAIEADKTIVIDPQRVSRFANENGITVVAIRDGKVQPATQAA